MRGREGGRAGGRAKKEANKKVGGPAAALQLLCMTLAREREGERVGGSSA